MRKIEEKSLSGERALFQEKDLIIQDCTFFDGESPLKESKNIELYNTNFKWKYPLWYGNNIRLIDCVLFDMARAGIWYTKNISLKNCLINAPKNFRRARNINLENVTFQNAEETLWSCTEVKMKNVHARGDYFSMNSENIDIENLTLTGDYSFDGAKNVTIRSSQIISKDAFWNSENVTIYDSFISGEYLGWNAKNLTLINCTVESLQGFCYIENLVMKNCKTLNTTLAFEYSTVSIEIKGKIDSIKNPNSGEIIADSFGEIIMEEEKIDPKKTQIQVREKE